MKIQICLIFLVFVQSFFGQNSDTMRLKELDSIVITAYKNKSLKSTSLTMLSLKLDSLSRYGNFNLTDLMAKTPGISMMTTGVAIAKSVIRGLYGNRVLMLISGLKFDNQQWQEEHGLGLSDLGISRVEIIKGPMSVLYGTEAIGGVINVIEEEKPSIYTKTSDYGIRFNSNTLGGLVQAGFKANYGKKWFRIRFGIENNGDYSDGNGTRVLNSRFDGYQLKSTFGFKHGKWTSTNNYLGTYNRYGFIFNDVYDFVLPDARWSRNLAINPCHLVLLNILSSENKIQLKHEDQLTINLGLQSNERMENEGGGAISLNMHLLTFQYLAKYERFINQNNRLIVSNLASIEKNTNFGSRKIVPDALMFETNISAYIETKIRQSFILENGLGAGWKEVKTLLTNTVNNAGKENHPFVKQSSYYNAFSGFTFFPIDAFNIKANIATGVRVPNLAELSSDGLHEGIFTYEIGNPQLKNEQNLAANLYMNVKISCLEFSVSPFYNYFFNYVYLAPTDEQWFGFPIYRYLQQNATQYGFESTVSIKPTKGFFTSVVYSGMVAKTNDGEYIPYTPAQKVATSISYTFPFKQSNTLQLYANVDAYFKQDLVATYEMKTPAYYLVNAGLSSSIVKRKTIYILTLAANNLLNVAYYDHLSRFKNYGLLNIGRNISIDLKIKLKEIPIKTKSTTAK